MDRRCPDYYRAAEQTWKRRKYGTWLYFPEGQESPPRTREPTSTAQVPLDPPRGPPISATSPSRPTASTSKNSLKRRRKKPGGQLNGPDWDWGERAESEAPTQDSIVTASDARPTPPRRDLPLPGQGMAAAPLLPAPPGIPHAGGPKVAEGHANLQEVAVSRATAGQECQSCLFLLQTQRKCCAIRSHCGCSTA